MSTVHTLSGDILQVPAERTTPDFLRRVFTSRWAALVWTAMRIWLGIMWLQAGVAKIWGAESSAFLHNGGAGVVGFATHAAPAYSWWGSFLHSFVVPNAGWIGVVVALGEFAIGFCLVLGLFTRLASLSSLALLFTYVMSGTASVCGFYALFALIILFTWRTSSWIGADGFISALRHHRATKVTTTVAPKTTPIRVGVGV